MAGRQGVVTAIKKKAAANGGKTGRGAQGRSVTTAPFRSGESGHTTGVRAFTESFARGERHVGH